MNFDNNVKQNYIGEEGRKYHDKVNYVSEKAYSWVSRLRKDKIFSFINNRDTVLEYGVGTGWNLSEIDCKERLGYDLSEHLADIVQTHGIKFINDLCSISDGSIDIVICHHVLEHITHPFNTLKEINRILCVGGKLLLFVPYETGKKFHHYNPRDPNHHLYSWNVQTLGTLVEKTGFKVIKGYIGQFGYDRVASHWAEKFHLGEPGFRIIRKLIHCVKPNYEVRLVIQKES